MKDSRGLGQIPRSVAIATSLGMTTLGAALACTALTFADQPAELLRTDSLAPYVHRLTLYDHAGKAIDPKDEPAVPYSPAMTCGKCHPVAFISHGWHFNAPDPNIPAGRPGEPWFLVDAQTGTVLPVSGRGWPGTFKPEDIGLSAWDMTLRFGRHMPGGGYGLPDDAAVAKSREEARWKLSGRLEVDCMFCHSVGQQHDPAEAARQIEAQNFRWAPTAALGLAVIRGEAKKLPDDVDLDLPPSPDYPDRVPPRVVWDRTKFDPDDRVLFDITRRPRPERCYFCHTVRQVGPGEPADLLRSPDVHLAAGLLCVDCHRNELDHMTVRGYAAEAADTGEAERFTLSCEGCHLGDAIQSEHEAPASAAAVLLDSTSSPVTGGTPGGSIDREHEPSPATVAPRAQDAPMLGRLGAPRPEHRGIPPVHFEKLTCTACHSGPWPQMDAQQFQTALAHGLGLATRDRRPSDEPLLAGPVFRRDADGRIAPHYLAWPAYWARLDGTRLEPLHPDAVRKAAGRLLSKPPRSATQPAAMLTDEAIAGVLEALARQGNAGTPVYVRSGRVYGAASGSVAPPYVAWPIAHDVRPASQALGVRGCTDCHAEDAPIDFGRAALPGAPTTQPAMDMLGLRNEDRQIRRAWAAAFRFRPAFKWFGFACAGLVALVLIRKLLDGLAQTTSLPGMSAVDAAKPECARLSAAARVVALAGTLIGAATAFGSDWLGRELAGWALLTHMAGAGLFTAGVTAVALLWVRRRREYVARGGVAALAAVSYWLVLALSLAVMGTMLLAMLPLAGHGGQESLVEWHERAAIGLLVMIVVYAGCTLATRRRPKPRP